MKIHQEKSYGSSFGSIDICCKELSSGVARIPVEKANTFSNPSLPTLLDLTIVYWYSKMFRHYLIFGTQPGAEFDQKSLFSALNMLAARFPELFNSSEPVIIQILDDFYEKVQILNYKEENGALGTFPETLSDLILAL